MPTVRLPLPQGHAVRRWRVSQRWLLLEPTAHLSSRLYRLCPNPSIIHLFDGTELHACTEESPLLISTSENPLLLDAIYDEPQAFPGLILESRWPLKDLLAHLRHILFIRFDVQRKGVLRYSIPRTASYFFPACQGETIATWLGPINELQWYGATWRDSAEDHVRWQKLENYNAYRWSLTVDMLALDEAQEQALRRQQGERFLHGWWSQQTGCSFDKAWGYLTEALSHGFASTESLGAYLDLRSTYPQAIAPHKLPAGNDQERLGHLAQYLERSSTNKERSA